MALVDRKMPIVPDVNDTPSTTGDPSHPNGSLMCSQYNALIDNELVTIEDAIGTIPSTTDDLTEGTTNKYFSDALARNAVSATSGTSGITYDNVTGVFDFSNVQAGISDLNSFTTDNLTEGSTNKYYVDSLARNALSATVGESGVTYDATTGVFNFSNIQAGISDLNDFTSDDLAEGLTNKYYSDTLFNSSLTTKTSDDLAEGLTNKYYSTTSVNTDFDTRLATKTTDDLTEGAINKYFSDALARGSITVAGNGSYDNTTGVITISNADISIDHITKTGTVGLVDTYTIYGDVAETIVIDTFTVTNGANGSDGSDGADGADGASIVAVNVTGTTTKTVTFYRDLAKTQSSGSVQIQTYDVQYLTFSTYNSIGIKNANTLYVITS